jgi:hypothetical protein
VLGATASGLRYQAYPTSSGTDSFSYSVVDRFGRTGTAALRVAIVPPGDPQPPVAADVTVTAAPGATVSVDVMAQAFVALGDEVTIKPLAETNGDALPGGARLRSPRGPIEVRASTSLTPVVVRYAVQDGLSASFATLTVRTRAGTNLPPVAADDYATLTAGHDLVSVDPLAKAYDPDGAGRPLRLDRAYSATATIAGGRITIPVTDHPQVVPYEISDAGGATAMAVVFVPARGAGAPHAKPGQQIDIPQANGSRTIDIADYAVDPAGKPLQLTTAAELAASPTSGLHVAARGNTQLVITAQHGYVGPAAITFQVTNGTSLTDPNGQFGVITVPVQVGPETPVLRCPTTPITVVEGGDAVDVPVTSLCHVWVADDAQLARIEYTATWKEQPAEVNLSGFGTRTLHLQAGGAARPGTTGTITVGVANAQPAPATLRVVVGAAPPPTVSPVTVDGVIAGRSAAIDIARYVYSPLHDRVISIVSVSKVSGLGARPPATSGSHVTLSPTPDAHGTEVWDVRVTDVVDFKRTERQAVGRITLHVLGVPDPPAHVSPGRNVLSHQVTLTWDVPANNGEPIDYYEVAWSGGSHRCPGSPCTITGLTNGQQYVFTVRAHNAVGWGKPSAASRPAAEPNAAPAAPTGLKVSDPQDGRLTLSWQPSKVDGTPVLKYVVSYYGKPHVTTATTLVATGLDNNASTTFRVSAVNKQGSSPWTEVKGQSAGAPQYPAPPAQPQALPAPTLDTNQAGDHQVVQIKWGDINANGPKPVTYTVTRRASGRDPVAVCTDVKTNSCTDPDVVNDGSQVSYTYVAKNDAGHVSVDSEAASFVARGNAQGIGNLKAVPTGDRDGEIALSFDVKPVRDKSATVQCNYGAPDGPSCGTWQFDGPDGEPDVNKTINVHTDDPTQIYVKECNTVPTCTDPAVASAKAFADVDGPTLSAVDHAGPNVHFSVAWNPHGGSVKVNVQVTADRPPGDRNATPLYQQDFDGGADAAQHTLSFTDDPNSAPGAPISVDPGVTGRTVYVLVTITDSSGLSRGHGPFTDNGSEFVPAGPKVALRRGATTCKTDAAPACGNINVTLTGFQSNGSVLCHFAVDGGAPGIPDAALGTDGNGNSNGQDLAATYSTAGAQITVTCESVSTSYRWPG